jgi:hypothetical protein
MALSKWMMRRGAGMWIDKRMPTVMANVMTVKGQACISSLPL